MTERKIIVRQTPALELPGDIEFRCPECSRLCKTNPKTRGVQHSLPTCKQWEEACRTEGGVAELLVKSGVAQRLH